MGDQKSRSGFAAEGVLVFTDIMLPVEDKSWRVVEVKSTTSVKDHHHDDVAIQAFVALAAGVPLKSLVVAHVDGEWVYPGENDYRGLLKEVDLTDEALGRCDEVKCWIAEAHAVVQEHSEPHRRTGDQCYDPRECPFLTYCKNQEVQPEYPIEWLPRLHSKEVKQLIEAKAIKDMRDLPDECLDDLQRRVKAHSLSGKPFFDREGAMEELANSKLPVSFLDFETIYFAVPIWKGTRPYRHIPYQFSGHRLSTDGKLEHSEFLDLSGNDPSSAIRSSADCHPRSSRPSLRL